MIKNTEQVVAERIAEVTNGTIEYVSGYVNKSSKITVHCLKCGQTYEVTYHHLTTHFRGCNKCKAIKREKAQERLEAERKAKAEERKRIAEQRKAEREARREANKPKPHPCPVCGEMTTRPKYCSDKCYHKASNSNNEIKRRHKIAEAMVDKDITLEGLYRRDKGVCHICGGKCDYEDYTVIDGTFIAGDWYPSIDHVVPLAKGGKHSWGNVKLAHRRCNSVKSDKFF